MLGMVEVESVGHGPEDSDVGWRAAVLGVVFFADGCKVISEQGVQLSGVRARHSRIWAAQLDDRLAHRSERTRDCLSADSLVAASVLPVASGVDQDAAHAGFHVLDAGQGLGDTEAGGEFGPVSPDSFVLAAGFVRDGVSGCRPETSEISFETISGFGCSSRQGRSCE